MSSIPTIPPQLVDHRDDYRNGFIDAVMYQQGIANPTARQIDSAVAVLTSFRAQKKAAARALDTPKPVPAAEHRLWR